jgi:hypothetical protein
MGDAEDIKGRKLQTRAANQAETYCMMMWLYRKIIASLTER